MLQSRLPLSHLAHVASPLVPGALRVSPVAAVSARGKASAAATAAVVPRIHPMVANKDIPGPKTYPIIGALPEFVKANGAKRPDAYFTSLYHKYGWISKLEIFGGSTVLLFHPEDIRNVYAEMGKYPSSPVIGMPALMKQIQVCKRDHINLAVVQFEEWKKLRVKLQKFIATPQQAISYLPMINPITRDFSAQLRLKEGNNLKEILPRYTFEVIAQVLFGKRMGAIEGADPASEKFITHALNMFIDGASFTYEFPWYQYWNTPKFKKFVANNEYLYQEGTKQVLEIMEKMKTEPEKYADTYVGRLLLAHDLTLEEMAENCSGLFVAGVDTTSNTLTWVLLHLAEFPEAQEKLHQELSSVLKGGDYDETLSSKLPYMKACLKESVRMDPVASVIPKRLETDFKTKSGHTIVAGTDIMIAGAAVFRDPKYVERPNEFLPERWFDEAKAKRVKENNPLDLTIPFYPFSFGARMCLGARLASVEMNSFIARIVQDFKLSLPADAKPYEKLSQPFLQPIPYPNLIFTPRK